MRDLLSSPWMPGALLSMALLAAIYALMEVRELIAQRDEHKADAAYWLNYVCWLEGRGPLPKHVRMSPMQAAKLVHDLKYGFDDETDAERDRRAVSELIRETGGRS